jgi:heptosyltransferase-1
MGDVLHGLPTLVTLKETFPEWEVDWLVERRWSELLQQNPCLTRVIEVNTVKWRRAPLAGTTWREFRKATQELQERNYDYALDLQGSIKSGVACGLSGAAQVIGLDRPWLREPPASLLYSRRVAAAGAAHVVEANLALAKEMGALRPVIQFPLPQGDDRAVPPELRGRSFAVINPGAGWAAKQWPASAYAEVCDELEERFALPTAINCGPGESALAEEVRSRCHRAHPRTFAGNLAGLIALLRGTRLMIGPDTGPLHLAAALGVPTVALYGPTDPKRNGPYGNTHRTLRPEGAVTSHNRSGRSNGQMERIRPSQVMEAVRDLLQDRSEVHAETDWET